MPKGQHKSAPISGHWQLQFPSDFLRMADLKGKDVTVTIKDVHVEELQLKGTSKTDRKPVLLLEESDKRIVLNVTNAQTIAKLHGAELRGWVGKKITLYPDPSVRFGKEQPGGIRVREKVPA